MPVGPVEDAGQQFAAPFTHPLGERPRFGRGEVSQLNAGTDIERRARGILDQLRRGRRAKQHEDEPFKLRLSGAAVEAGANGGEKLVGEGEADHPIHLIHEHHHAAFDLLQHDLSEEIGEALGGGQHFLLFPPFGEDDGGEANAVGHLFEEAVVELIGCDVFVAFALQVHHGAGDTQLAEVDSGAGHEAGFAHLAGGEDGAILAGKDGFV